MQLDLSRSLVDRRRVKRLKIKRPRVKRHRVIRPKAKRYRAKWQSVQNLTKGQNEKNYFLYYFRVSFCLKILGRALRLLVLMSFDSRSFYPISVDPMVFDRRSCDLMSVNPFLDTNLTYAIRSFSFSITFKHK